MYPESSNKAQSIMVFLHPEQKSIDYICLLETFDMFPIDILRLIGTLFLEMIWSDLVNWNIHTSDFAYAQILYLYVVQCFALMCGHPTLLVCNDVILIINWAQVYPFCFH